MKRIPLRSPTQEKSHLSGHTKRASLRWNPLEELLKQPFGQSDTLHSSSEAGTQAPPEPLGESSEGAGNYRSRPGPVAGPLSW